MAINEKLLIPDTAIEPSFKTVTYTGDSSSSRDITGVGFQPDLVWIKNRSASGGHWITDSIRGAGKGLMSQSTLSETTSLPELMSSFNSDGFTVGYSANNTTNFLSYNYVAWCFNAGGVEETNTDGDHDSTVRANNDLGFSIVETINTSGEITFGHGLDTAPEMIINKATSANYNWLVYHKDIGTGKYIKLNSTDIPTTNAGSFSSVSSTTITDNISNDAQDYINYCFASKTGVSKVGTYTGTGTSGNVIPTGFEPAFVMIKNIDDTGSWLILDNVRDTDGVLNEHLYANLTNAEATAATATITPTINGFTIGNSNSIHLNRSGDDFIYYAIADI